MYIDPITIVISTLQTAILSCYNKLCLGYLYGKEDYYTHHECDDLTRVNVSKDGTGMTKHPNQLPRVDMESQSMEGKKNVCGLDFHDGDLNVWNFTGHYSTHLFTQKAVNIIQHQENKTNVSSSNGIR